MTQSDSRKSTSTRPNNTEGLARARRLLARISELAILGPKWIGIITLILMMFLITVDVILRSSIGKPILGAYELIQFLMVILIFFALPYTAAKDGHVTVDFVYERFSKRGRAVIDSIAYFLSFALYVLICWQSIVQGIYIWESKQVTLALGIPIFGFLFVMALGCALLCLVLMSNFVQSLAKGSKK